MDQLDLLRLARDTLERISVRYAIVGSFASGAWGEPRMTHDIDIVIDIDPFEVEAFCNAFGVDDFYLSKTAAHEAVDSKGQFTRSTRRRGTRSIL